MKSLFNAHNAIAVLTGLLMYEASVKLYIYNLVFKIITEESFSLMQAYTNCRHPDWNEVIGPLTL